MGFFSSNQEIKRQIEAHFRQLRHHRLQEVCSLRCTPGHHSSFKSSPSGYTKEDLHSIFSNELSTKVSSTNSRVLFSDEVPTEGMEQDGVFTENSAKGFHEKTNQSSDLDQRNISSSSQGKAIHKCAISGDTHKGLVARRESELEM